MTRVTTGQAEGSGQRVKRSGSTVDRSTGLCIDESNMMTLPDRDLPPTLQKMKSTKGGEAASRRSQGFELECLYHHSNIILY